MRPALEVIETALDYIRLGKLKKAQEYLEHVVHQQLFLLDDLVRIALILCRGMIILSTGNCKLGLQHSRLVLKELSSVEPSDTRTMIMIRARNVEALSLFNMGRRNEALVRYEENLTILQKRNDLKEDLSLCLNNIGYYHLKRGGYAQAFRYFEQAITTLKGAKPFKQRYELLIWRYKENLALTLISQGRFNQALELLDEMLEQAEESGDHLGQLKALHDLGIIMREQGNFSKSRNYFNNALLLARRIRNQRHESMILGDLGELCLKTGPISEAHQYLLQSVELSQEIHNEEEMVKRLCQLSEVEDLLGRHDSAMERLNQASQMAQHHASEEEIEYVKFALATNYFRKGLLEIAAIFFMDVYHDSLGIGNSELILNCHLYLSAIQISRYLEERSDAYLSGAREHLDSLISYASRQHLVSYVLIGKILMAILQIFTLDLESAEIELEDARNIASNVGNEQVLRMILNLKTILTYFLESKNRGVENVDELTEIFMTHGSLTFLREFVIWTTVSSAPRFTSQSFADAFVIQEMLGPELFYISPPALNICSEEDLIRSTYALTAVFGQGSHYFEGLYGPIPISRTSIAMVFTKLLPDSKSPDTRYEGRNYCIYVILFPFDARITIQTRECLENILDGWFNSVNDVRGLTEEWFSQLRQEITTRCFDSAKTTQSS